MANWPAAVGVPYDTHPGVAEAGRQLSNGGAHEGLCVDEAALPVRLKLAVEDGEVEARSQRICEGAGLTPRTTGDLSSAQQHTQQESARAA